MKQFDLKEYLANPSRKLVTRDGRNARIVSTDFRCANYPIVAFVQKSDNYPTEEINTYTENGEFEAEHSTKWDLFFAPEKHEGWVNIYRNSDSGHTYAGAVYDSKEDAEKRKIIDENYVTTIKIEWEE